MLQHGDGEVKLAGQRQWDGSAAGFHSPQREGEGGPHLVDGHRGQEIEPTRGHGKELAPLLFCERLDGRLPLLRSQAIGKTIVQRGQLCEGEGSGERGAGQLLRFLRHLLDRRRMQLPLLPVVRRVMGLRWGRRRGLVVVHVLQVVLLVVVVVLEVVVAQMLVGIEAKRLLVLLERRLLHVHLWGRKRVMVVGLLHVCRQGHGREQVLGRGLVLVLLHERLVWPWHRCRRDGRGGRGLV